MPGKGMSTSMREMMPAKLAALIAAQPDRLLHLVELSYGELRKDIEGPGRPDFAARLLTRVAAADNARRDLTDWLKKQTPDDSKNDERVLRTSQSMNQDLARLRTMLQVAAAVPVVQIKAKALQMLLDVHLSTKELRDLGVKMVDDFKRSRAAPRAGGETAKARQQQADQRRSQERERGF